MYWFTYEGHLLPNHVSVCDIDLSKGIGYASFMRSCGECIGTGHIRLIPCSFCNGTGQHHAEHELVHDHYHFLNNDDYTYPFIYSPELTHWKLANSDLVEVLKLTGSSFSESLYNILLEGRFLSAKQETSANEILTRHKGKNAALHTVNVGDKIAITVKVIECVVKTSPITNLAYYSFVCLDESGKHYIIYQSSIDAMHTDENYQLNGVIKKKFRINSIEHAVIGIFNLNVV